MRNRNLPQPFQIDKVRFKDCFTAPGLRHFAVLVTGWVLTVGVHTISQVILTGRLHESEHFATPPGMPREPSPSRTCSLQLDAVISTHEFRAIPGDTAHHRKSCRRAPRAALNPTKGRNYSIHPLHFISQITRIAPRER